MNRGRVFSTAFYWFSVTFLFSLMFSYIIFSLRFIDFVPSPNSLFCHIPPRPYEECVKDANGVIVITILWEIFLFTIFTILISKRVYNDLKKVMEKEG